MTSISTYGQAQAQLNHLKDLMGQADTLQEQATSGKKSTTIAGLGANALTDLQSNASLASLTNYDTNITTGQTQLSVMSNVTSQIQTEATTISTAMEGIVQNGNADMGSLKATAQNALSFIKNLLNEKNGQNYVFSGADAANAPLGSTDAMTSYINSKVSDWTSGKITTDQLISSFTDSTQLTDTTIGYSAPLTSGKAGTVAVKADDDAEIDYTTLANDPAFRSILVGASMLIGLTSGTTTVSSTYTTSASGQSVKTDPAGTVAAPGSTITEQSDNYYKVFNSIISMLTSGTSGTQQVSSKLGYAESSLKTIQTNHTADETTLQNTIAGAENIDLNDVAVKLSSLQTQLQAAYQVTASMQKYSLVNYLSA